MSCEQEQGRLRARRAPGLLRRDGHGHGGAGGHRAGTLRHGTPVGTPVSLDPPHSGHSSRSHSLSGLRGAQGCHRGLCPGDKEKNQRSGRFSAASAAKSDLGPGDLTAKQCRDRGKGRKCWAGTDTGSGMRNRALTEGSTCSITCVMGCTPEPWLRGAHLCSSQNPSVLQRCIGLTVWAVEQGHLTPHPPKCGEMVRSTPHWPE